MGTRAVISLENVIRVTSDIAQKLGECGEKVVEISDRLPAAIDPDVILGQVYIWRDIQSRLGEGVYLRVYAEVYNPEVEKYVVALVQNCERILITPIPIQGR